MKHESETPTGARNSLRPATDVFEGERDYLLVVELPGQSREGVELTAKARELELVSEGPRRYERRFKLPEAADLEQVEASFEAGVLSVRIPKREALLPKKIAIRAA